MIERNNPIIRITKPSHKYMKLFSFRPKKINIGSLYEFFKNGNFNDGYLLAIKQKDGKTFDMVHVNHLKGKMYDDCYAYCECPLRGIEEIKLNK